MNRLRMLIVVVALVAFAWIQPCYGQRIRFAQVTDPHLFDSQGKPRDNRPDNQRGFRWAIEEINRRNSNGPAIEFVAFTGDLGLEKVEYNDDAINRAALEFKEFIDRSDVKRWIMVPGNNDLIDENPTSISHFHKFVAALNTAVGGSKTILDFAPIAGKLDRATLAIGKCLFAGFADASFKSNNSKADQEKFKDEQEQCLIRVDEMLKLTDKEGDAYPYVYIFCHIPDIDDPYVSPMSDDARRKFFEKGARAGFQNKSDGEFPASAWTVNDDIRKHWNAIIHESRVRRVFAGHFHYFSRWVYYDLEWDRAINSRPNVNGKYQPESFGKLLICPPIAVKNQIGAVESARGFRDVTVYADTGNVTSEIIWNSGKD